MHQPIVYDENKSVPILLVRSGEYRAAIQVDRLIGSREIVVKPIGPQFSNLRGVSGATIMGDGRVVLIIDPAILVRLAATEDMQPPEETVIEEVVEEETPPTVMIVDDSITVRKVTTRFLERNDMGVLTAKDGVDALQQLQLDENIPDVMLLDVEMPRMDGFELATNIRNDERLKNIPIIMITSRTGAKHRDRAMNIGVNVYLGKPYNEAELLENIHTLSGK
jgi:chemosensory pili system protein ChpA (sensor histidine kinase/response regulator)